MKLVVLFLVLALVINLFSATSAFAYLDPSAWGYLRVVILIVFTAATLITVLWGKIKLFIKNLFK